MADEQPQDESPYTGEQTFGRPTKYRDEYVDQVHKLLLLASDATDKDIADFFNVDESTITRWKQEYPDFCMSIHDGKVKADAEVANGLFHRAKGAEWTEEVAFKVKKVEYENGRKVSETEEIATAEVRKAAPPDTNAARLWLMNRRGKNWKDKQTIVYEPQEVPDDFSDEQAEQFYVNSITRRQ